MSGVPPGRRNEERVPMVQDRTQNQQDFSLRKFIKTSGSIFLVLVSCGAVAYGLTAVVWYLFEDKLAGSASSTTLSPFAEASASSSANAFVSANGDSGSLKQFGWYILVFLLGGVIASILGAIAWYYFEEKVRGTGFRRNTQHPILPMSTEHVQSARPPSFLKPLISTAPPENSFKKPASPAKSEFRIVGFYDGSSTHKIRESQLQKLTHIVFSSLDMNSNGNLSFKNFGMKRKLMDLVEMARRVNPYLKVMVSIFEWSSGFHAVAEDREKRINFVSSITTIILTHQIDGIDLFWKWPSETSNRESYVLLLSEIRQKLTEFETTSRFLLTVVMPSFDWPTYKDTIDLNGILEYVDFMNVRTINYYGFWFNRWGFYTGPPAPLYSGIGQYEDSNVDWTMKYCSSNTGMPTMLNLGVPFFGAYWKDVEGSIDGNEEMWFTAKSKTEGEHDYDGDYLGWRDMKNEGWATSAATWHQESRCPFIWVPEERKFLGFENPRSLAEKVKYAIDNNIGGITIWSVEMDDDSDTLLCSVRMNE